MRVLSISTDRKIFEDDSLVLVRNLEYASKMDELHIVVFSLKKQGFKPKNQGNLFLYPTNSSSRLFYILDALRIGKQLIGHWSLGLGHLKDVVITTQDPFETGLVGYFLRKKNGIPLQIQVHTDFLDNKFKKNFLNKIRVWIAKFIVPKAQGIRVVSVVIADSIKKHFSKLKIIPQILPIFVDIEKIINAHPEKYIEKDFSQFKFIIFMASRLTKEKKIDVALHVMKKVLKEFPQTGLVVAGSGPEKGNLINLSKKLGISKNVFFIGWQKDLISYYKTADMFLLTSDFEGYGMTLVEAAASRIPIVTTKVGIAKTDLFKDGKNCSICQTNDIKCVFDRVSDLIHDNMKRELFKHEMNDNIKSIIIRREDYVEKYVGLLENLIQK